METMDSSDYFESYQDLSGLPKATDLQLVEEELPPLKNGEYLAEALYLSVDPYMRAYASGLELGTTFIGRQVAKVTESKNSKHPVGQYIYANVGWRTHTVLSGESADVFVFPDFEGLPLSLGVGVLGMPGCTAYFGFLEICRPKPGETVVVTGAAGAVGSMVGQIAKIKGCTVIGVAGSGEKGRWLVEDLGFDHFVNYKDADFKEKLKEVTPKGVDCYFDNVGGEISSIVLRRMNMFGRVTVCGAISAYNEITPPKATTIQRLLVGKQLKLEGFIVRRWMDRMLESLLQYKQWIKEGKMKYRETMTEGFENMFTAFVDMLQGENIGKAVVKIHQLMLKDVARNRAYKQAIFDNKNQFKGRTVLDVGSGTGILSIFCAQAGASKVYAVEASDVYKIAEEVVRENGFEGVVKVIHSRMEDVTLPEKVDIIISEWMGFYLLHEAMLDSVIAARDKFLKPGGLIFPESATLYSAPCCVPDMYELWDDVEGISMQSFGGKLRSEASHKPITSLVSTEHVLSDSEIVLWIDLREVTLEEVGSLKIQHVAVANKVGKYQGICLWFSCTFPSFVTEPVTLSTSPEDLETHWKQTTIVLPAEIEVEERSPIAYELSLARASESNRRYNIEVTMLDPEEVEHQEYCGCHLTKCILVRAMLDKYEADSLAK